MQPRSGNVNFSRLGQIEGTDVAKMVGSAQISSGGTRASTGLAPRLGARCGKLQVLSHLISLQHEIY
jgi:hypothetical protein